MRIGIDGRFWNESGVGRYIRNLVFELNNIDRKNEYVLFVSPQSEVKKDELGKNWNIVKTDIRWHSIDEQMKYPTVLNSYHLDLVHFPYFSIPVLYTKPFVVTIHDLILHHFSTGKATTLPLPMYHLKRLGYKFIMRRAAQSACHILTVSNATKHEIVDHLSVEPQKITVTYEGVDLAISNRKQKSVLSERENYFLYVGNSYPHKNLEKLFYAFSALPDVKTKLYIVGQDDYFSKQMKHIAHEDFRNPNIVFLQNVSDKQLATFYQNALALVSPSLMEGFGLPLVEAMSQGCLILASDIPSSKEIAGDAALYFNPNNITSISGRLHDVLENKQKFAQKIKKGKERALQFSWDKTAKETLSVYESCLQT